jgi:dipeptidyl aminopeptidase/acylaminoacyl peptidase
MKSRTVLLAALFLPAQIIAQSRPQVRPADYGRWESLTLGGFGQQQQSPPNVLSPNGQWLAYGVNRVNEENELRLGATARDTTIVIAYGTSPAFSGDSRWLAYGIGVLPAERDKLTRDKKPIHNSAGIRNVATGATEVVKEISSFRFSGDGRFLALRRYPAEGKRAADLIVQDLARGTKMTFGNVGEFAWADGRALLAITVETEGGGGGGNAVQLYDASAGTLRVLDSSPSLYRMLAWREKGEDLAVLRTRADKDFRDTTHVLLAWTQVVSPSPVRRELDPSASNGVPVDLRIAEHRRPEWSRDASVIFIGLRPRDRMTVVQAGDSAKAKPDADKVSDVQVWHVKDVRIMPMQKVQEQQDVQRTMLAAWNPVAGRVVRIGTDLWETARVLEGGRYATETDHTPFKFGAMFGRPYTDVYVVNVKTGERRKAIEKVRYFFGASTLGQKLLWFDGKDYWSEDVATGARTNLSAKVQASFTDPDDDHPSDMKSPNDLAGWTSDDRAVLVADEFDVWSLAADGSGGKRLTNGAADGVIHRYMRVSRSRDERGIDLSKPVYFSLFGKKTKQSGYARLLPGRASPERLFLEDTRTTALFRADSSDVYAFTRERFDDSPDWFAGNAELRAARQISKTNPFQASYAWGHAELVSYKTPNGRELQGALLFPANYDPSKKYPMIVNSYELMSQTLHQFSAPSERSYYNHTVWTQNGYFVLKPDIVFRARDPGISVLEAIVPAVHAVVARGLVDSARVGFVGHSWGGYEAAFLPTRTNIFSAVVAGAPITNMMSFAGQCHWSGGVAELDHLETGQARMEVPYWEDVAAYARNDPAAMINKLRTPIMLEAGDADGTVDWHQSVEFYNFARRAGVENLVMIMYPGEDHGLRKKENQIDYHRRINQWFGHWLKGEPAPKWMMEGMTWAERKTLLEPGKQDAIRPIP